MCDYNFVVRFYSFEKPDYYDFLKEKYNSYYECFWSEMDDAKNNQKIIVNDPDQQEDEDEDCSEDEQECGLGEVDTLHSGFKNELSIATDRPDKKKMRVEKGDSKLFRTYCGDDMFDVRIDDIVDDDDIVSSTQIYCVDYSFFQKNLTHNIDTLTINYPGGFVLEPTKHLILATDIPSFDGMPGKGSLNITDFEGLYSSTMRYTNSCPSTLAVNSLYPILVNNKYLVHPFNNIIVRQLIAYLKLNKSYIPFIIYILREKYQRSILYNFIDRCLVKRKKFKDDLKKYDQDSMEYVSCNVMQLFYKRLVNALYGKFNDNSSCFFEPLISTAITYTARLKLCSWLFFLHYFLKNYNLVGSNRGQIYGDTDSIFFYASEEETKRAIKEFNVLEINQNLIKIDFEKSLDYSFILSKKNYITYYNNILYMKGIIKKSQSQLSKTILSELMIFVFKYVLPSKTTIDQAKLQTIDSIFDNFINSDISFFVKKEKVSKGLNEYKTKTMKVYQLLYASKVLNKSFPVGTEIQYSYYNYIFDFDIVAKIKDHETNLAELLKDAKNPLRVGGRRKKTCPQYSLAEIEYRKLAGKLRHLQAYQSLVGLIDYDNPKHLQYISEKKSSTYLISDLVDVMRQKEPNICIDKSRMFDSDLKSIMEKVLNIMRMTQKRVDIQQKDNVFYQNLSKVVYGGGVNFRDQLEENCLAFINSFLYNYNRVFHRKFLTREDHLAVLAKRKLPFQEPVTKFAYNHEDLEATNSKQLKLCFAKDVVSNKKLLSLFGSNLNFLK